jgi:hypothetical protein
MSILLKIFLLALLFLVGIVFFFLIRFQLWKIKENKQGWRTRPKGRDTISYQQRFRGKWKSIEIDGELLSVGKKINVIYFKSQEKWVEYPEWAQNRKRIIQRVKMNYPPEKTEYENDGDN